MPSMKRFLCAALLVTTLLGCGTIGNMIEGPMVMGGLRTDIHFLSEEHDLESYTIAMYDIPFSFALDIGMLPITLLSELFRWITGWPPKYHCRSHGGF